MQDDDLTHQWQLALAGDRTSFQALLDGTYGLMFQYGCKFTRDRELVKDGIQDVFLEIFEKRATINADIPPKAYLLASLRRRLHRLGERQRWVVLEEDLPEQEGFGIEMSFEHHLIHSETTRDEADQLARLINQLPARQQEALYLRFFQGLERDDIAYLMDIQPQSVSNLQQEAFKWLRLQWKPFMGLFPLILPALLFFEKKI
ncbi:RNA polymerase sigma factor [Dyadobacter sandarakinus]|uniref:Sigma-70 family RNA polymerase sigma factor n=1 Tax=Dyadobacter sandarakinus TaxID=2747268 RepID=A0ABX7I4X6_9BACT|nr:sigma-70 family RNA polymerase sigma factor [Dyadobacter sandarakinus]QRR00273.1 sigma-70 family RNA polymerase sigma factor [Dyadobacter sandarakinus]